MLSLVLTFAGLLLALPQVTGTGWGASTPGAEPASASPNTGTGPSTDRPGVGEAVFANGEAASAFAAAHNSCAPTSAEITGLLPAFDWMGRVRIGHVFTVGG